MATTLVMRKLKRLATRIWTHSPSENWRHIFEGSNSEQNSSREAPKCIWCLSTGRVGSATLAALGSLVEAFESKHEPYPLLFGLGKQSYEISRSPSGSRTVEAVFCEAVRACRPSEMFCRTRYLETSPQGTFLAPHLMRAFPGSRFIHLVRNPAEVIRSGMRRKWYDGHPYDRWRIEPTASDPTSSNWSDFSPFEKNAWCWAETNMWITDFMMTLPTESKLTLRSEDLFSGSQDAIMRFYDFLGAGAPPACRVRSILLEPLNRQRTGEFPLSSGWTPEQVDFVYLRARDVLEQFDYKMRPA